MSTLDLPSAIRDPSRTARWAGVMFLLVILLQRFAVPGVAVGMTLPAVFAWMSCISITPPLFARTCARM
jgi:hypothetical protein